MNESAIEKQMDALHAQLDILGHQRTIVRSKKLFTCGSCQKKSQLSKWILIVPYFYNKSYCSYEDSTWDFKQTYWCVCPKCNVMGEVRCGSWMEKNPKYATELATYNFVHEYRANFKEQLDWYENDYPKDETDTVKFIEQLRQRMEKRKRDRGY
jgi:hypothetical protein